MPFDPKNLHREEAIVLDLHPHWVMLAKGVAVVVITTAIGMWLLLGWDADGVLNDIVNVVAVVAIIASVLYLLQRWIAWVSTNFVVTTDRCIYREGIVAKRGVEIPLERINTIFFNQGVHRPHDRRRHPDHRVGR